MASADGAERVPERIESQALAAVDVSRPQHLPKLGRHGVEWRVVLTVRADPTPTVLGHKDRVGVVFILGLGSLGYRGLESLDCLGPQRAAPVNTRLGPGKVHPATGQVHRRLGQRTAIVVAHAAVDSQ